MAATYIPLTTVFTPPADCLDSLTLSSTMLLLGADPSCLPSGANTFGRIQTFSPAFSCPESWTSVADDTAVVGNTVAETRLTCCPDIKYLSFAHESRFYLHTTYSTGFPYCSAWISELFSYFVLDGSSASSMVTENITFLYTTISAPVVQIAWQATDLVPTRSSSSLLAPVTSSPTPASAESESPGGLSTVAKISMGVVIPVVVLALLLLGFFIMRRRKSKGRNSTKEIQQEIMQDGPIYPMESTVNHKLTSPQVGYAALQQGHQDDYEEQSRSSQLGQTTWGSRTTELPRYGQQNM